MISVAILYDDLRPRPPSKCGQTVATVATFTPRTPDHAAVDGAETGLRSVTIASFLNHSPDRHRAAKVA
jgi:hypothetical protein